MGYTYGKMTEERFVDTMIKAKSKIIGQVWRILSEDPESRNDDTRLQVMWLREQKPEIKTLDELMLAIVFKQGINFESIRRARQLIQARGYWLPTDETVIKKRRLQRVYEVMRRMDPSRIIGQKK